MIDQNVLERLRESKRKCDALAIRVGREAGKKWARDTGEYDELVRLAGYAVNTPVSQYTVGDLLNVICGPEDECDDSFLVDHFGLDAPYGQTLNGASLAGFVAGATEVFEEVHRLL